MIIIIIIIVAIIFMIIISILIVLIVSVPYSEGKPIDEQREERTDKVRTLESCFSSSQIILLVHTLIFNLKFRG